MNINTNNQSILQLEAESSPRVKQFIEIATALSASSFLSHLLLLSLPQLLVEWVAVVVFAVTQ